MPRNGIRNDWKLIESLINTRSTVLDIGCGKEYILLKGLKNKIDKGYGIETCFPEDRPEEDEEKFLRAIRGVSLRKRI